MVPDGRAGQRCRWPQKKVERPLCTILRMPPVRVSAAAASGARLARAPVYSETVLEETEFARRAGDGRAGSIRRRRSRLSNTSRIAATRRSARRPGTRRRRPLRRQAGAEQALRGVDVAHAGHHPLVEQRRLQRRQLARPAAGEVAGGELRAERIGAEARQMRMRVERRRRRQVHVAEPARIVEPHARCRPPSRSTT